MATYFVTDDVELLLIARLRTAFPGLPISRTAPAVLPAQMVTLRRTGGLQRNDMVDQAHLDIMVYGATPTINDLALRVQACLNAQRDEPIRSVTASGPADLGGDSPRRYMYADVNMRRSARKEITP